VSFLPLLLIPVYAQETNNILIPSWVKGVANFWVEDKIDDGEFAEALEFLIDSNIIQLGDTVTVSEQEISWEEKYNTLLEEKNSIDIEHKSQIDQMMQEYSKGALEMDEEYNAMLERLQTAEDEKEKYWKERHSELSEEIGNLKAKIKELEK